MNKFAWLKPLLTLVVALALGAGMLFLGTSLAPHQTEAVDSGTEVVPVIAPVAVGDEEPADDAESEQLAEREVNLPAPVTDELDPSVQAIVDGLAATPDPAAEVTLFEADAPEDGSSTGDDGCAPREGEPSGDCPDGIRSTILPLVDLGDFVATAAVLHPDSPSHALYTDCAPETLDPTDGSTPFGIYARAPGHFTLELRRSLGGDEPPILMPITTPDAQRSSWNTALEAGTVEWLKFCLATRLDADTGYTGTLTGISDDGRIMRPYTFRFNTGGSLVHPGLQLVPVGENLLFASAAGSPDELVDIRAIRTEPGVAPSCDVTGSEIAELTVGETELSADQLTQSGLLPEYTQNHSEVFRIHPGETVIVCARWFDPDRPSWRDHDFESSAVAQAPDRLLPLLVVSAWHDGAASPVQRVEIDVSTAEGVACGSERWMGERSFVEGAVVCSPWRAGASGVSSEGDRVWDLGFAGDLVVRGEVTLDSGFSQTNALLPAVDGGCRGTCTAPAPHTYRLTMAGVTVDLLETWEPSSANGNVDWNLTDTLDQPHEYVAPDLPQLDVADEWTSTEPAWGQDYVDYTIPVHVDRPVDYVLTFGANEGGTVMGAPRCIRGGTIGASGSPTSTLQVTGSLTPGERTITMRGVCLGGIYDAYLQLTDADGHVALWGNSDRETFWGSPGVITAPLLELTLHYQANGSFPAHSHLRTFALDLGFDTFDFENTFGSGGLCSGATNQIMSSEGDIEVALGATTPLTLRTNSARRSDSSTVSSCDGRDYSYTTLVGEGVLSINDLFNSPRGVAFNWDYPDVHIGGSGGGNNIHFSAPGH